MATPSQYLEKAASYIGISGTDNIFNTWYWGFHCYDPNVYPWCAAFQSYVGVHDLSMQFNASASAAGVAWQGQQVADSEVQPGDWVLFNWDGRQDFGWADHIGVVEWSDINGSGYFGTIEGNTGWADGGEVARCTRYNYGSYSTKFFRPPYADSPYRGVHTHTPNQTDAQRWVFEDAGEGAYFLRNVACGKYLQLNRDLPRGDGYAVCVGPDKTPWELVQLRADQPLDKPAQFVTSGLYLDVVDGSLASGAGMQVRSKSASTHGQKFALVWAGQPSTYFIHNLESDMCVDVDNGGRM